ncbi:hypothetical protein FN846DRAFT_964255 [Sphaerosporella brunnea]|uniref:Uncharacterized protein n=1 Tax=Sphaerosporella brunnea TaxID=1250544 RepID=A0A5J5EMX2_9PEZI|nr:hypothetical protein FN846DRAFT_964255 [Sphaerosporella brunnea]
MLLFIFFLVQNSMHGVFFFSYYFFCFYSRFCFDGHARSIILADFCRGFWSRLRSIVRVPCTDRGFSLRLVTQCGLCMNSFCVATVLYMWICK